MNGTGTGELVIDIHTPDHIPLGSGFLMEAKKAGTYNERITVKAEPDPECDPTQGINCLTIFHSKMFFINMNSFIEPCEQWLPGTYNVTVQLCNGECGSQHPHSSIYATAKGAFQLTG